MPSLRPAQRATVLSFVLLLLAPVTRSQCNTDQNPYCAGNNQFEQLCCTYPNVCYWSNRNGDPACCAAGTDCSGDGGPAPVGAPGVLTQAQETTYYVESTYLSTIPQETAAVVYYTSEHHEVTPSTVYKTEISTPSFASLSTLATAAVVVVTDTFPVVQTVAPATEGAIITVTQVQVISRAGRVGGGRVALTALVAVGLVTAAICFVG